MCRSHFGLFVGFVVFLFCCGLLPIVWETCCINGLLQNRRTKLHRSGQVTPQDRAVDIELGITYRGPTGLVAILLGSHYSQSTFGFMMGILDRLSGHGYAILVSREGEAKELDFDTWGRESILGARTIRKLVLPTINKISEELDDTSFLVSIINNHRVFSMHTAALMSACNLVAICSQSTNPVHIFKQLINGCRAGMIEYGHIFSEFPEQEYREGIFLLIHQYANVLLSEYQSQPGDRATKLQSAAREAINTLLVLISETYPYENGLTVAEALSHDSIRKQLIVIYTAIEKWVGGYVTHNAAKLLS